MRSLDLVKESSFKLKCLSKDYFDVAIVGDTPAGDFNTTLNDLQVKCTRARNKDDIDHSVAFMFVVDTTTVLKDSPARELLEYAIEKHKPIFPAWGAKSELPADLDSILFRYQLTDLSDAALFRKNMQALSVAILTVVNRPAGATKKKTNNASNLRGGKTDADSDVPVYDKIALFLAYDKTDIAYAKSLFKVFDGHSEIMLLDCSSENSEHEARHCTAVLAILSAASVAKPEVRNLLSVAENNRKPIFGLFVEK